MRLSFWRQHDWLTNRSARRCYTALNETLEAGQLRVLVERFLEGLVSGIRETFAAQFLLPNPASLTSKTVLGPVWSRALSSLTFLLRDGERRLYEALIQVVDLGSRVRASWLEYVRSLYPEAPTDFERIGRNQGNAEKQAAGESPRLWPFPVPFGFQEE